MRRTQWLDVTKSSSEMGLSACGKFLIVSAGSRSTFSVASGKASFMRFSLFSPLMGLRPVLWSNLEILQTSGATREMLNGKKDQYRVAARNSEFRLIYGSSPTVLSRSFPRAVSTNRTVVGLLTP